jgi:hypothetical protein
MAAAFVPPLPPFDEVYSVDQWYFYYISKQIKSQNSAITRSQCIPFLGCNTTAISYCIYYKLILHSRITQPLLEIDHIRPHLYMLPFSVGINIKQDSEWITDINRHSQTSNKNLLNTMSNYLNNNSLYNFINDPAYIRNGENIFLMYFVDMENYVDNSYYIISHYFVIVKLSEDEFVLISSYGNNNVQISLSVKKFRYEEWEIFVTSFIADTQEERSSMGEFFKSYFLNRNMAVMPSIIDNPRPPSSIEEGIETEVGTYIRQRHRIACIPNILDLLDITIARPLPSVPHVRQPSLRLRRSARIKKYSGKGGKTKRRKKNKNKLYGSIRTKSKKRYYA